MCYPDVFANAQWIMSARTVIPLCGLEKGEPNGKRSRLQMAEVLIRALTMEGIPFPIKTENIVYNGGTFLYKEMIIMAASQAKRLREKLVREGKMDPSLKRGSWHGVNPVERKPERPEIEKLRKEKKHRRRLVRGNESDVSFFYRIIYKKSLAVAKQII